MIEPTYQTPDGSVLLFLADCRAVLPQIAEQSIDVVVTDPPYGHNNNNNGDLIHRREAALGKHKAADDEPEARPIANDGPEANQLLLDILPELRRAMTDGSCCCCCCGGGGGPDPQFARWSLWIDKHLDFKQMVVWDKGPMGMGWHYRRSYETILVAQKPGAACKWYDTSHAVENIIRPSSGIRKIIPQSDDHPTPKPASLYRHFIDLHSQPGDVVLDPFMGSGPCADAAVDGKRKFIGIEIDPVFFDMAVKRVERAMRSTPTFDCML
jgi:site-specific DNA-methyltransferase (adenine-specific)